MAVVVDGLQADDQEPRRFSQTVNARALEQMHVAIPMSREHALSFRSAPVRALASLEAPACALSGYMDADVD